MTIEKLSVETREFSFNAFACGPVKATLVLCLHGFLQFSDSWFATLQKLGEAGFRGVAFDQRGYSETARPRGVEAYRIESLLQDVLDVASALNAEKFHLVGHDWGGKVAWYVASRAPERLLSLTVLSTPHPDALLQALKSNSEQQKKSWYVAAFRAPFHFAEFIFQISNWNPCKCIA